MHDRWFNHLIQVSVARARILAGVATGADEVGWWVLGPSRGIGAPTSSIKPNLTYESQTFVQRDSCAYNSSDPMSENCNTCKRSTQANSASTSVISCGLPCVTTLVVLLLPSIIKVNLPTRDFFAVKPMALLESKREIFNYRDLHHWEIRLLTVFPAEDLLDPVRALVSTVSLDDKPLYDALSYVWGDDDISVRERR